MHLYDNLMGGYSLLADEESAFSETWGEEDLR
jgi:hypothetical protein